MKKCSKCGNLKALSCFHRAVKEKDGLSYTCKTCSAEAAKKQRLKHPEQTKASKKKWSDNNKERMKELSKKWATDNPERIREASKKWASNNQEKVRAASARWRHENPEKRREVLRKNWQKTKRTPKGKLNKTMSNAIRNSLINGSKANRHWENLVDFTIDQLKTHLEKNFQPGMVWDNYGIYWHIDHKIPLAAFNYERPEDLDFKRCWVLKNLQPLEAIQNKIKSAKLSKPFQPSLQLRSGSL